MVSTRVMPTGLKFVGHVVVLVGQRSPGGFRPGQVMLLAEPVPSLWPSGCWSRAITPQFALKYELAVIGCSVSIAGRGGGEHVVGSTAPYGGRLPARCGPMRTVLNSFAGSVGWRVRRASPLRRKQQPLSRCPAHGVRYQLCCLSGRSRPRQCFGSDVDELNEFCKIL
jgi:hypothetical protein